MDILTLYLLTTLDGIDGVFRLFITGGMVAALILSVTRFMTEYDRKTEKYISFGSIYPDIYKHTKKVIIITALLLVIHAFIPTTKQAYMIAGGYYATNIENIEQLPPNAIKAVNKFLEQYTEE